MSRRRPHLALLLALLLAVAAGAARADDWPQQGGSPARAGQTPERCGPGTTTGFSVDLADPVAAAPVVVDGVVVVAGEGGLVRGLAEDTGALLWTTDLSPGPIVATPACGQGRVVVAGLDGRLTCLSVEDGGLRWDLPGVSGPRASVAISGDLVVCSLGFPGRELVALDLRSGQRLWSATLAQVGHSAPAVDAGLVVVGADDGAYEAHDATTGALAWRLTTGGNVLLSAAALAGPHVLMLPGGEDQALHGCDRAGGGAWSAALVDPAPPGPAWAVLGASLATATPVWTGTHVACLVRFDYVMDRVAPWYQPDAWVSRERLYLVDPVAASVVWSIDVGAQDVARQVDVPPYGTCPSPCVLARGGQTWLGVASSLSATVSFVDAAGGTAGAVSVPGARWSPAGSPALGNGRVALATDAGRVLAVQLDNAAPAAPVVQAGGQGTLTWAPAADADDAPGAVGYVVRFDDDGEVLLDADVEVTVPAGQTGLPFPAALASDTTYTVRVRARDASGALSPWSVAVGVTPSLPPAPPRALVATGASASLAVEWLPSTSAFVTGYRLAVRRVDQAFGAPVDLGPVTRADVTGLEPFQTYEVRLVAVSSLGRESAPVTAQATTQDPVTIGGQTFASLPAALAAARPGDVVLVGAGTFHLLGPLGVPTGVTLRGVSAHHTRIAGSGAGAVLTLGVDAVVEQVAVFGGDLGVTVLPGATARLTHVLVYDVQDALDVGAGAHVVAAFVTLVDARGRGVIVEPAATLELSSAIVTRCEVGVDVRAGTLVARWNTVGANRSADRIGAVADATETSGLVPAFLDLTARDYREPAGAPTVDRGDPAAPFGEEPGPNGGRANQGAFGGTSLAATSVAPPADTVRGGPLTIHVGSGCALGAPGAPAPVLPAGLALLLLGLVAARRRPCPAAATVRGSNP